MYIEGAGRMSDPLALAPCDRSQGWSGLQTSPGPWALGPAGEGAGWRPEAADRGGPGQVWGANGRKKRILRRLGWAPRLRILPGQQPAVGMCFPASPPLPALSTAANRHSPGSAHEPSWTHSGPEAQGFLGGSQRMLAAGVKGAEASGAGAQRPGE